MSFQAIRYLVYGFLLGTAGVKVCSTKEAKKQYVKVTAAALRGADSLVETAEVLKENCEDILAEAKNYNAQRETNTQEIIPDTSKRKTPTRKRKTSKK